MRHYLAGPMSGYSQGNFPLFDRAATRLRERGFDIISPAELDDEETRAAVMADKPAKHSWGDFLARDVKIVADQVKGIILLPGWYCSRGAKLEAYVGILCGHEFHAYYPDRDKLLELSAFWVMESINAHSHGTYTPRVEV
jgi:hypothetical protein